MLSRFGRLRDQARDENQLRGIPREFPVRNGQTVVTGGFSGLNLPSLYPPDLPIGREDTRLLAERLARLPEPMQDYVLPRALQTTVERYAATGHVQDVSTAARAVCESEGERMESELSTIRYIAWAIPSVGFIGTVRGIGDALGQAHRAVEGDITSITESLGVAFNSTFVALVLSIVLMFFIHQVQRMQEQLALDSERYVDLWFIRRLRS